MGQAITIKDFQKTDIPALKELISETIRFSINAPYDFHGAGMRRIEDIVSSPQLFTDTEVAKFLSKQQRIILIACEEKGKAIGYAMLDPKPSQMFWPLVKSGIAARFIAWHYGSPIRILSSGIKSKRSMKGGLPKVPRGFAEISIGIKEDFTRKGVGSMLLPQLEAKAKQKGVKRIGALISSPNTRSIGFFEKHKYTKSEKEYTFLDYKIFVYTKQL